MRLILAIVIALAIINALNNNSSSLSNQKTSSYQASSSNGSPAKVEANSNPLTKIETVVKKVGDFEVTILDQNKKSADKITAPPYEVIVNSSATTIRDCFDAKTKLFDLMKNLYSDEKLKKVIGRVKFTAWGQLRSSLGADDAKELKWDEFGPSLYWNTTLKYKSQEDENGDLETRTWGVKINKDCN